MKLYIKYLKLFEVDSYHDEHSSFSCYGLNTSNSREALEHMLSALRQQLDYSRPVLLIEALQDLRQSIL